MGVTAGAVEEETTLYRIYGDGQRLLYVGITRDYELRMRQHSEKAWWRDVRGISTETLPTRAAALTAESHAIKTENPVHNRAGTSRAPRTFIAPQPIDTGTTWITIQDAAELMSVTPKTIRRWISSGLIYAKRMGPRLIRVDASSLEKMGRQLQYWNEP